MYFNFSKTDASLTLVQADSYLTCLPLMMLKMKKSDINALIPSETNQIIGRGRRNLPKSSDEKELLSAIQRLKLSYPKTVKKRQKLIPFVHDTPGYVHVIARRKEYLMKKGKGFTRVPFKSQCTNHTEQNLDFEISQLITF